MFVNMDGECNTATVFSPNVQAAANLVHEAIDGRVLSASAAVSPPGVTRDDRGNQFHPTTSARDKAPAKATWKPA
jgi:hypothetical protein